MRIAINGFGRIGKNFLYALFDDPKAAELLDVVAINTKDANVAAIAHFFKYDTFLRPFPGTVETAVDTLIINGKRIGITGILDPSSLPWGKLNIDVVVDCSGFFTHKKQAELHIKAGAKKVLISAPAHDEDVTIIPGVNMNKYNPDKHTIISLGSCTTNAFLPVLKVIHDKFTMRSCLMTTAHAYTNSQALLDSLGTVHDLRKKRAAALNIVPTTTGASSQVEKVLPELAELVQAIAIRVPVGKVSLLDVTFTAEKEISIKAINQAFQEAQDGNMRGIITIDANYLVSSDFNGDSSSVIIDVPMTSVQGSLGKVFGWYDNEWAYSVRLKDFLLFSQFKKVVDEMLI